MHDYTFAMIVPAACYMLLCLFAFAAGKAKPMRSEDEVATSFH